MIFGATVVGARIVELDGRIVAYALASLTVIRMLPVSLSLLGRRVPIEAQLFVGWFGPRGLASIVFAVVVVQERAPGSDFLAATVVCTVVASILLHGLTANPLSRAFGARTAAASEPRS